MFLIRNINCDICNFRISSNFSKYKSLKIGLVCARLSLLFIILTILFCKITNLEVFLICICPDKIAILQIRVNHTKLQILLDVVLYKAARLSTQLALEQKLYSTMRPTAGQECLIRNCINPD